MRTLLTALALLAVAAPAGAAGVTVHTSDFDDRDDISEQCCASPPRRLNATAFGEVDATNLGVCDRGARLRVGRLCTLRGVHTYLAACVASATTAADNEPPHRSRRAGS